MRFKDFLLLKEDTLSSWYWKKSESFIKISADFYFFSLFMNPEKLEATRGISIDQEQYGSIISAFFEGKEKCYNFLKNYFVTQLWESIHGLILNFKRTYDMPEISNETIKKIRQLFLNAYAKNEPKWVKIYNTMTKLYNATTLDDMQIWIDNIYDLQHTTGSIFTYFDVTMNDEEKYDKMMKFLEFKKNAEPKELLSKCSNNMHKIGSVMLNIYGM